MRPLAPLALGVALAATGCRGREVRLELTLLLPDDAGPAAPPAAPLGPEAVELTEVAIRSGDDGEQHELYDEELAKAFGRALSAAPGFVAPGTVPPPGVRHRRARAEVVVTVDASGAARRRPIFVAVEGSLRWVDGDGGEPPSDRVLVEQRVAAGADLEGAVAALAADAVGRAAAGVIERQALRNAPDEAVIAEIGGADPDRVRWALVLAGERRLRPAIDAIVPLLAAADRDLAGRAIGALVAIGDPRAVAPLTAKVDFQDYARLRMLIEAAVALGGEEASEFLEFVESGHPDEDIKARASDALARLRRR